jgi:ABC-type transport system involved in cytochrome c biogenesis ATPase subunit
VDVGIVFDQDKMLFSNTREDATKRKGSINFIVGINGTGKSSLLRALYQSFRALKANLLPAQPVTLAWDRFEGEKRVTCLLHISTNADEKPWFAVLNPIEESTFEYPVQWQGLVHRQGKMLDAHGALIGPLHFVGDAQPITSSLLEAHLPQRLVAYTSGDQLLWTQQEKYRLRLERVEELNDSGETEDDRPPGWTIEREWNEDAPQLVDKIGRALITDGSSGDDITPESITKTINLLDNAQRIRDKVGLNNGIRSGRNPDPTFRVHPRSLRLAGISVALWQAAKELKGRTAEWQREELRQQLLKQPNTLQSGEDARGILRALDWFWPTHLSFTYHPKQELTPLQQQQVLCLVALADEVTAQPRGYLRAVIFLGAVESLNLPTRLSEAAPYELPAKQEKDTPFDMMVRRINGSATGAEAVMRVFSNNTDFDTALVEMFEGLRKWEDAGFLHDLTLTIKRLNKAKASDGKMDDVVICYEDLSDGEQMLLGRMALVFLLRRQDGTLLLLDEPETHFNDVWKREMIDLVDDAILKTTTAQVIVATHTSIALTDVFSSEIVRFVKPDGVPKVEEVAFPTFGADPGRILLHVFGSPDTIGSRAAEFLREKLKKEWKKEDLDELERLVSEIGSGWPRAKLAEILSKLEDAPPSP